MKKRNIILKSMLWYFVINLFVALLINIIYITNTNITFNFLSGLYIFIAAISNTSIFFILFTIVFGIIFFILPSKKLLFTFMLIFIPFFHIFLFIDAIIYKTFKFHFNSLVLNLFLTEGAFDSVKISLINFIFLIIILIILFVGEYLILKKIFFKCTKYYFNYKYLKIIGLILLVFILADKSFYAFADLFGETKILYISKALPSYQPLTIKRTVKNIFGYEAAKKTSLKISQTNNINYPKSNLIFDTPYINPNFIFIVIDGWRFDMLEKNITPNIYNFSKKNYVFKNHYSGGNASRFGVFSLLYGVYGNYWHQFLQNQISPVFLDYLMELDYKFKITSSTKLTYPEFRRTAFNKLQDNIDDEFDGKNAAEKDIVQLDNILNWLKENEYSHNQIFAFSWFDAPHGPYNYPDEFEIFIPSKKSANYITVSNKDYDLLKNSYKNAIFFNDYLIGKILEYFTNSTYYDNTILIITADHGEEFNEHGFLGHTSAFTKFQSKVPLIIYLPETIKKSNNINIDTEIYHLTSHHDIIPFLMELLGCKSKPALYSNGKNIFTNNYYESVFVAGWDDAAIITDKFTFVFSTQSWNSSLFEVRDSSYNLIEEDRNIVKNYTHLFQNTLSEMGSFFK